MVLSRRERYILVAGAALLVLLVGDRLVLGPLLERRSEVLAERDVLTAQLTRARALLARRREAAPLWRDMQPHLANTPAEAESRVFHMVRDAAEAAGLSVSLQKPERLADKTRLPQIAFQAVGSGSMRAVSGFLWRLETAPGPLRILELQVGSRKEGTDDLTVSVRMSTLYLPDETRTAASSARSPAAEEAVP